MRVTFALSSSDDSEGGWADNSAETCMGVNDGNNADRGIRVSDLDSDHPSQERPVIHI